MQDISEMAKVGAPSKKNDTGTSSSPRQQRRAHQKFVDRVRGLAAFADRPDDERPI